MGYYDYYNRSPNDHIQTHLIANNTDSVANYVATNYVTTNYVTTHNAAHEDTDECRKQWYLQSHEQSNEQPHEQSDKQHDKQPNEQPNEQPDKQPNEQSDDPTVHIPHGSTIDFDDEQSHLYHSHHYTIRNTDYVNK
jgi:hypothetical protein